MSLYAITWAWQQDTESSGQRLVLLAMADAAGGDFDDPRACWPRVSHIAAMTRLGDRIVRRHIDRLEEMGLIAKHKRRRHDDGKLAQWTYLVNWTTGTAVPEVPEYLRSPSTGQEPSLTTDESSREEPPLFEQPSVDTHDTRTRARQFPKDWQPGDPEKATADKAGLTDPNRRRVEWEKFRSYHEARGTTFKDWPAAWRNWCHNAASRYPVASPSPSSLTETQRLALASRRQIEAS